MAIASSYGVDKDNAIAFHEDSDGFDAAYKAIDCAIASIIKKALFQKLGRFKLKMFLQQERRYKLVLLIIIIINIDIEMIIIYLLAILDERNYRLRIH